MSSKPTDTATVKATYSTAATFMQSPSPTRMEKFDRWLNEVKAQAWDQGHGAPCDEWWDSNMCREYHPNPYRKGN